MKKFWVIATLFMFLLSACGSLLQYEPVPEEDRTILFEKETNPEWIGSYNAVFLLDGKQNIQEGYWQNELELLVDPPIAKCIGITFATEVTLRAADGWQWVEDTKDAGRLCYRLEKTK